MFCKQIFSSFFIYFFKKFVHCYTIENKFAYCSKIRTHFILVIYIFINLRATPRVKNLYYIYDSLAIYLKVLFTSNINHL